MKHTAEPWELVKHIGSNLYGGRASSSGWFLFENAIEKDAARIVACVNACAGMEDPETVMNIIRSFKIQIDGRINLSEILQELAWLKVENNALQEQIKDILQTP
jgi:hypothetical protein